jgi:mono/diheme cytochrome c family protein
MRRALICGMCIFAFWTFSVCSILQTYHHQGYLQISDGLTVRAMAAPLPPQVPSVTHDETAPVLTRHSPWLDESQISQLEVWISRDAPNSPGSGSGRQNDAPSSSSTPRDSEKVTYTHVAPIFNARCVKCHAPKGQMGAPPEDIRLDSFQTIVSSSEYAIVVPGFPRSSLLVRAIRGEESPRMPMDGPPYLDPAEIDLIAMWVQQGARDPAGNPTPIPARARIHLKGTLTDNWELDGIPILVGSKTHIRKNPVIGTSVEVRGHLSPDGRIEAREIRSR